MSNITKIEGSSCVLAKLHISVDLLNSYKKSIDQESELNRKSFASTLLF